MDILRSISPALAVWIAAANLVAFALMGVDKRRAVKGRWRVRERTLFLSALLLGAPGAFLGMRVFRHKTKKLAFRIVMPALCVIDIALYLALAYLVYLRS